ncbi:MAG: DUF542 domain-containing protein [Gemmatimonadaceae bacterium]|nr:DUF542 domain-containing protein [Chitinophagaceae bacterium]
MQVTTLNMPKYMISPDQTITDIVLHDYRTAEVFTKLEIDFCCGGRQPLQMACTLKGLSIENVLPLLNKATTTVIPRQDPDVTDWSRNSIADYITDTYHDYLRSAVPLAYEYVTRFAQGHEKKFSGLVQLKETVGKLANELPLQLQRNEEVLFPTVKALTNLERKDTVSSLTLRDLRKSFPQLKREYIDWQRTLWIIRELTDNFNIPSSACVTNRVAYQKLKEIDANLQRYLSLVYEVLLAGFVVMEQA